MKRLALVLFALGAGARLGAQPLETVIQKGHELAVLCVALGSDSNYVVTGSRDKSAKLWELRSGREVRSFLGHEASVTAVALSPDNQWLLTGSNDMSVRLWETGTGKSVFSLPTIDYITAVAFDPRMRFFVLGGYNRNGRGDSLTVVDFRTRQVIKRLAADPDKGNASGLDLTLSPDGKWMILGEDDHTARLFSTEDWKEVRKYRDNDGQCGGCGTRAVFSPDSQWVYLISEGGALRKYPVGTGAFVREYEKDPDDVEGLALNARGTRLARATEKAITVWDEATGTPQATLPAPESAAFHEIAFTHHPDHLLVTCANNTAFVWDVAQQKIIRELTGFLNQRDRGGITYDPNSYWESNIAKYIRFKNNLLLSRDGQSLIKGKFGTLVKQWDVATGQTKNEFRGHAKAALCYVLTQDGSRLITGGGDGKIIVWNALTGDSLLAIDANREPIFDIQLLENETHVASCAWDATLRVHDLRTGKMLRYLDLKQQSAYNILAHPSNQYILAAQLDNSLQLFELDTQTAVRSLVGHTDVIASIRFSANYQKVLSASWDGSIRVWDVGTGLQERKLKGHQGAVHTAIYDAAGTFIFSAGADRQIRQWDASGKIVRVFDGHQAEVTTLLLSADGKLLISHSLDGATKFWDLATGKEFFEHIHLGPRDWMVKNPEGYFSGTADARQHIHFVSGSKTYGVEQFFEEYYRPDLLPRIFKNRGASDEKRSIEGKLRKSPPPSVKITALPLHETNEAELLVQITHNGAPVEALRLLHNGKSVPVNRGDLIFPRSKGETTTYSQVVPLVPGTNTFSAIVRDKDRVESEASATEVESRQASRNATCYVLAVGINSYKNPKMALNYARPDAESFVQTMKGNQQLFKDIQLITLYDEAASRAMILRQLDELAAKAKPEDVFVFYYAGHGSMVDGEFFFVPSESLRLYDISALRKEAIDAGALQEKFKQIKALKQLIVMDACQSGGSVELLATRGAAEEKAIAQLSRSAGIHVMASAGSDQFATEFAELGHGLFTYLLIKALQGEADGAPRDGKVTIYELKSYLDDQVPELTRKLKGKPQYPHTFSRGQDFPVKVED
ncbi:MAG: caspase family protein [Cyclobacteriaceae bacterium]|jgi:WD40 repeat protein|nr:caspase family protein [Cyclobacteriaceae bacterium]